MRYFKYIHKDGSINYLRGESSNLDKMQILTDIPKRRWITLYKDIFKEPALSGGKLEELTDEETFIMLL